MLFSKSIRRNAIERDFASGRGVLLKDTICSPFRLIFLFDCNKAISFLGLCRNLSVQAQTENGGVSHTPFNSFVLDTVTDSKAFAAASTAAILVLENLELNLVRSVCSFVRLSKEFVLTHEAFRMALKFHGGVKACVPEA
jgi:hypothetical protein